MTYLETVRILTDMLKTRGRNPQEDDDLYDVSAKKLIEESMDNLLLICQPFSNELSLVRAHAIKLVVKDYLTKMMTDQCDLVKDGIKCGCEDAIGLEFEEEIKQ